MLILQLTSTAAQPAWTVVRESAGKARTFRPVWNERTALLLA
jgi:hypothetical protein